MALINNDINQKLLANLGNQIIDDFNLLLKYHDQLDYDAIVAKALPLVNDLGRGIWDHLLESFSALPDGSLLNARNSCNHDYLQSIVSIGNEGDLTAEEQKALIQVLLQLKPWRKGPFRYFGEEVDAEWRSDMKWARIVPELQNIRGKKIADLGCGNGYYMFRALSLDPESIVGFEPYESFYFAYHLAQKYLLDKRLSFLRLGVEDINLFPQFFDVVLCMGIIYHQKDPLEMLRNIYDSMASGGLIIVESQGISSDLPLALFPFDRYAQMRNVYYLPSAQCIKAWLERSGFVDAQIFSEVQLTTAEQRSTCYGSVKSLADYLDKNDSCKTIEGYPAPLRSAVKAYKK
ncbi:MAG: tRNA 5-methoxyuridine(34)/uridine 5-oxyacetic acid(34) synthase CmoB [Deltaproteobacteria bacterium]|nr:tRNA 5-methoxyuridine(34)/uridine 5-oxyacetic acid(34) synthase CmoB [Deltaproteobacteria bacterium]